MAPDDDFQRLYDAKSDKALEQASRDEADFEFGDDNDTSTRPLYLIHTRNNLHERAHFAILVVSSKDEIHKGTLIQAIGAPMVGYALEFKRNWEKGDNTCALYKQVLVGEVDEKHLVAVGKADGKGEKGNEGKGEDGKGEKSTDDRPRNALERVAKPVQVPRINENFMAPVNDTTNRRCQEWTMDFVNLLVRKGMLGEGAVGIVQRMRDPPGHGIGLRPARGTAGLKNRTG